MATAFIFCRYLAPSSNTPLQLFCYSSWTLCTPHPTHGIVDASWTLYTPHPIHAIVYSPWTLYAPHPMHDIVRDFGPVITCALIIFSISYYRIIVSHQPCCAELTDPQWPIYSGPNVPILSQRPMVFSYKPLPRLTNIAKFYNLTSLLEPAIKYLAPFLQSGRRLSEHCLLLSISQGCFLRPHIDGSITSPCTRLAKVNQYYQAMETAP